MDRLAPRAAVITEHQQELDIQRQDYGTRGSYVATAHGVHGIARLAYRREQPGIIVAERTETSPALRALGVDLALVKRMVEDARTENVRIYAVCPYVEEQRLAHPEWHDIFRPTTYG